MTPLERQESTDSILAECRTVMGTKQVDYASKEDVLANFKNVGARAGLTKYQIFLTYFLKHIDSIANAIKYHPDHPFTETKSEPLRSRVVDAINYLTLLVNLIDEDEAIDSVIYTLTPVGEALAEQIEREAEEGRIANDAF